MKIHLKVWRQAGPDKPGTFVDYTADHVSPHMSFLEMLDVVNEGLIKKGEEPIAFDSDCREGICGTCGFMISGIPHGSEPQTTVCQLHMRKFSDGDSVTLEPWRAKAFPVLKDLIVDRSSFDRIIQAGGGESASPFSTRRSGRPASPRPVPAVPLIVCPSKTLDPAVASTDRFPMPRTAFRRQPDAWSRPAQIAVPTQASEKKREILGICFFYWGRVSRGSSFVHSPSPPPVR